MTQENIPLPPDVPPVEENQEDWQNFRIAIQYTDVIKGVVLARAKDAASATELMMKSKPDNITDFQIIDIEPISDEDLKLLLSPTPSEASN